MLKRIITGLILAAFVVLMLYFGAANYIYIDMMVLVFSIIGTYEIYHSFKKAGYIINCIPIIAVCLGIYPLWHFLGFSGLAIILAFAVVLSLAIFTFRPIMEMKDLMATIFAFLYPIGLLSLAFVLTKNYHSGVFTISFAIFLPVFADVFAYFTGSTLKGPKLCPSISPKKTISGSVGGKIGAMLCGVLFFLLFDYFKVIKAGYVPFTDNVGVSAAVFLILGLLGGFFAEIGDLAASRLKRSLGIKDFGNIFPGHGGVLDRLDSVIFTLVLLFIALEIMY